MQISEMPGYGLPTFDMWPMPWYEIPGCFLMYELKLVKGKLKWFERYIESNKNNSGIKADVYSDYLKATEFAKKNSIIIESVVNKLDISDVEKNSLSLKVEKAILAKRRLIGEEYLMLREAKRRNDKFLADDVILNNSNSNIESALYEELKSFPYIRLIRLNEYGSTYRKDDNGIWVSIKHTKKTAEYCYRERVARGFGFSGWYHWGKTKASIRSILLPQANKLLQLASVKLMLADALHKGQKVLVSGSFIFWYESKGNVGWTIKEVSNTNLKDSADTIWKKGKIISKNHGRIVVLPYIKSDGQLIPGHTKNAPSDGKALPRHKDDYVELPFEVLENDLMIGLFGELPYE